VSIRNAAVTPDGTVVGTEGGEDAVSRTTSVVVKSRTAPWATHKNVFNLLRN
jgi:hypothetical protein